ncbi:anti-anti-sigma factor [Saccharothrix tamanrassetensis]|uniref:Anti-anti-sigma factor n=1 Tax=Saccharothrix tamanrassetensis TaxID=1051531 RepID=A0A841CV31_9PSEU|nr:SpoIIE family protein phosphatase [Saccharothrix tamanrassetensis]MBB5960683.1 anti-anti-sigma factor [Saccharothrix tamanrassetensis]
MNPDGSDGEGHVPGTEVSALVDGLPVVVYEADARSGAPLFVSAHAAELLGRPAQWWIGRPDAWESVVHPEDHAEVARFRARTTTERDESEATYRAVHADGRMLWLHERLRVVRGGDGSPERLRGVLLDVTGHWMARDRESFLSRLDGELQRLDDAEDIMSAATRLLGEHLSVDRCAYAQTEPDEDHFLMSGDHATGLPPLPGRFAMREFGEDALRAMRAGEPWVVVDSENDPRLAEEDLAAYRFTGIRAVICLPLLRGGRFVAAMAVHQAVARPWTPAEVELVSVAVNRCWESLQRVHADRALRDSEQRHRLLVEQATDAIWTLDLDLRFAEANAAACALLGRGRDALIGTAIDDLLVAEDEARLRELVADVSVPRAVTEVWHLRRSDGTVVAVELSAQTTRTGVQAIGRDVTERLRVEAERELLRQREHEIAETLQRSLLPRELPALDRLAVSARYLPASAHGQIGGDWYEVLALGGTTVALSVGDVVGKGPTAAAVMGQLRSALAGYLLDGHSPAAALERLDAFAARIAGAAGSTCACLTFDWSTGELCWAVAGHPPPLVVDQDDTRLLAGDGAVLCAPGRAGYRDRYATLRPGTSIVLYTDGLVERPGDHLDAGLDTLLAHVGAARGQGPDAMADAVTGALLAGGQHDDVALVIARHLPPPLRRRVPARPAELAVMRRHTTGWAHAAGLSEDLAYDLQLALGEAAANAVDHAYTDEPGDFEYSVRHTSAGVQVTVRDNGCWRPPTTGPTNRGRGLQLIDTLSDDVVLHRGHDGTTITFHLADAPQTPALAPPEQNPASDTVDLGEDADPLVQRLRLTGDLDTHTVPGLRAALLARIAADDDRAVEVDLTGLGYLSSSGVALLLEAAAAASGHNRSFTITTTPGSAPARILDLSGLVDIRSE